MNEEVIRICKQLQTESQTIIDYMQNGTAIAGTGTEQSIKNVELFNNLAIDNVDHCQKLVIALAACFFQQVKEEGK